MKNRQMLKLFSLLLALSLTAALVQTEAPVGAAFAAGDVLQVELSEEGWQETTAEETGAAPEEAPSGENTGSLQAEEPAAADTTSSPAEAEEESESTDPEETGQGTGDIAKEETPAAGSTEEAAAEATDPAEAASAESTEEAKTQDAQEGASQAATEEDAGEGACASETDEAEAQAFEALTEDVSEAASEAETESAPEAASEADAEAVEAAAEDAKEEAAEALTEEEEGDLADTESPEEEALPLPKLRRALSVNALASEEEEEAADTPWGADSEDPLLLAAQQPDYFELIDTSDTTRTSDSEYSFTITPNEKSRLTYWVDPAYADRSCLVKPLTYLQHEAVVPLYDGGALGIVPKDDDLSGHFGVWITNAGSYWGTDIDVKITVRFHSYTAPLTKSSSEEATIYPILLFSLRRDGLLGVDTEDLGCTLTYELYRKNDQGEEEPIRLNMCLNFGDIDGNQTYGFKVESGSLHGKPQVVAEGSEVYARVPGSTQGDLASYWWMISKWHSDYTQEPYAPGEVRFELENTQSFSIVYGSWMAYSNPELHDNRYQVNQYERLTRNFGYSVDRYRYCCEMIESGSFDALSLDKLNVEGCGKDLRRMNISYFTSYSFLPYDLPAPKKAVTDPDESHVSENTLTRPWQTQIYEITQSIPKERPEYRYSSFVLTDVLPEGFLPVTRTDTSGREVPVFAVENTAGTDVTQYFSCTREGRTVTITAGPSALKSNNFYNGRFTFRFRVQLTETAQEDGFPDPAVNTATAKAVGKAAYEAVSNEVRTHLGFSLAHPTLTITKKIDRSMPVFGSPSFLFRIEGNTTGRIYHVCIPIPEGETTEQKTITLQGGKEGAGEQYTITELPVARYQLAEILPSENTAVAADGKSCLAVVADAFGAAGEVPTPMAASVTFRDTLSYAAEFSHTDTKINTLHGKKTD